LGRSLSEGAVLEVSFERLVSDFLRRILSMTGLEAFEKIVEEYL